MTRPHESIESSSPIVTRAVAAGLQGQFANVYDFPVWQRALLLAFGALPQSIGRAVISNFQTLSGLPPQVLNEFSLDVLIGDRLRDYAHLEGRFPSVAVGAALGGATTYLSLATRSLFLPQTFVLSLQRGSYRGDVNEYLHRSLDAALKIAADDPRLMTIQHFDPLHDGWLVRFLNHLRFKLLTLPDQYADFIKRKLEPGGAVIYLEGRAQWLRYRVGPRSVFQIGGWGDISAEEFLESSDRIKRYATENGLRHTNWRLTEYPLERGPESEWGSEPGLAEALADFCAREGYRFVRIPLPHPNDFSRLAFAAAKKLLEKEGREPQGTLVETFSQFDSTAAMQGSLLPLWLIFNTNDSARYLKEMSAQFPKNKPIFFSPLSTFSLPPDMTAWNDWVNALGRTDFINIGTRASHYPSDTRALVKWQEPLRVWIEKNRQPITARLSAEELLKLR